MPHLTTIAYTLQTLFTDEATRLARDTGLVQRHSKLTGPLILLILVAGFIQHPTASYNILAQVAADYGVRVTRQAVQERLTPTAVTFFRGLFQRSLALLQQTVALPIPLLAQFGAVYLLDSSQVALPARLADQYPGTGGDGPRAGIKGQVLWEILAGNLRAVLDQPAKQSDHRYREYLSLLEVGSLILFDLGYVALEVLRQLVLAQVYFICRWNPRLQACTTAGQPLDLGTALAGCRQNQVELTLCLGVQAQLPLRVVASRLPVQICEQRRRRAHATEKKRGFQYSSAYLSLLDWNIYITNVPPERLSGEQVRRVYGMRWQVELLFKLWKMQGELDHVAGRTGGRVMCELYAKLLGMVVFGYLTAPVRLGEAQELSPGRAWQVWQRQIEKVAHALRDGRGLTWVLTRLYALWERFGQKDPRKNRPTSLGQLQQEEGGAPDQRGQIRSDRGLGRPKQGGLAA